MANNNIFNKDRKIAVDAIKKAKKIGPEKVISQIKLSGLKGRGGAGFLTGLKWELVLKEKNFPKYIVCNAHEGEPATFKDRHILMVYPHLVIGGLIIAANALQVKDVYVSTKETFHEVIKKLKSEIVFFKKQKLLSGLNINILPAKLGYIGGEETALLNEIEGKRVEPRNKPPYVSSRGLYGKPTIVNNVESFANIPFIISKGVKEFKKFGTEKSPGIKVMTITGAVKNPGVKEIEIGKTVNEILSICGGAKGKIKFALSGGYEGTLVLPNQFDIPLDFNSAIDLGPGNIIFFDQKANLKKNLTKWFRFFAEQSCGQCTPCREGSFRLYEIIIKTGEKIKIQDLKRMEEIFKTLETSSFCPLGLSIPRVTRQFINEFKEELVDASN